MVQVLIYLAIRICAKKIASYSSLKHKPYTRVAYIIYGVLLQFHHPQVFKEHCNLHGINYTQNSITLYHTSLTSITQ